MEPTYGEWPPNSTKQLTLLRRYQRLAEKTVSHAWLERGLDGERNECSHIKNAAEQESDLVQKAAISTAH